MFSNDGTTISINKYWRQEFSIEFHLGGYLLCQALSNSHMLGQTNLYVNRSGTRPDKLLHCLYGKTCVIYRDAYIQVVRNTYAYTRIFFRQINRHDDFYTRVIRESCLLINELPLFSLKTNTFFFFLLYCLRRSWENLYIFALTI